MCAGEGMCEDYYPADDDQFVKELIDEGREEFYSEWNSYISEGDDRMTLQKILKLIV